MHFIHLLDDRAYEGILDDAIASSLPPIGTAELAHEISDMYASGSLSTLIVRELVERGHHPEVATAIMKYVQDVHRRCVDQVYKTAMLRFGVVAAIGAIALICAIAFGASDELRGGAGVIAGLGVAGVCLAVFNWRTKRRLH